jgi:GH15 family glucan-1,4-alpha-glucosidase
VVLPATDRCIKGTVEAVESQLLRSDLVLRYFPGGGADGLPPGEGVFLPCSFWLIDNYVLQGRRRRAMEPFERLLALRSDVGLLAEEYSPEERRLLGNYPQALTHVALINTAIDLMNSEGPAPARSHG